MIKIAILLILQNTSQILENMRKLLVWYFQFGSCVFSYFSLEAISARIKFNPNNCYFSYLLLFVLRRTT